MLEQLCKYGLPSGDLYEFSALTVLKYEKKHKFVKKKELQERLAKREKEKQAKLRALESDEAPKAIKAAPESPKEKSRKK